MNSKAAKKIVYPGKGVDFIIDASDRPGDFDYLDVPNEYFEAGDIRGQVLAFQLMAAAERLPKEEWDGWFDGVIAAAAKAIQEPGKLSRKGAGAGVLYIIDQLLAEFARSGLWREVMKAQLSEYRQSTADDHQMVMKHVDKHISSVIDLKDLEPIAV